MNLVFASRQELFQIAADEGAPLDIRYCVARELQRRRYFVKAKRLEVYTDKDEQKIAELYLKGYLLRDIGNRLGRTQYAIEHKLEALHKAGLPYRTAMRWAPNGKVPTYMRRWLQA